MSRAAAGTLERSIRMLPTGPSSTIPEEFATTAARMLQWLDHRTGQRIDVSRAGRALLHVDPRAVERLAGRLSHGTVVVSATNGKTTTVNLLASMLDHAGLRTTANRVGANMPGGIVAELLADARIGGRSQGQIGAFEIDELWLDQVFDDLQPNVLVLMNLAPDQLVRTGGVDRVATRWRAVVEGLPATTHLVLGADDPVVSDLAAAAPRGVTVSTFGLDHTAKPSVWAEDIELHGLTGSTFTLFTAGGEHVRVHQPVPGRCNVLNAIAAATAASALGITLPEVAAGLSAATVSFGRFERITVDGTEIVLTLAKNAAGLTELVHVLQDLGEDLELLVLVDEDESIGSDQSWLGDGHLDLLIPRIVRATCGGKWAADAAKALLDAGYGQEPTKARPIVLEAVEQALDHAVQQADGVVTVIATYWALIEVREILAERGYTHRYWA